MSKAMQLFILPYAGGSVAAFRKLTDLIDGKVDVVTVEYAGRGSRAKETLPKDIWEMVDDAVTYCNERRNKGIPFAIMGYSMGSVLAYEMLTRKAIPGELKHFFISAEVSPKDRSLELRKAADPSEERILERVRQLGGLDERLLSNKRFRDIYITPMLNDYRAFFGYRFPAHRGKVSVNATVFYSEKDTALEDVKKWNELIEGEFVFFEFGDNHFFINQHYREMAEVINNTLLQEV